MRNKLGPSINGISDEVAYRRAQELDPIPIHQSYYRPQTFELPKTIPLPKFVRSVPPSVDVKGETASHSRIKGDSIRVLTPWEQAQPTSRARGDAV